MAEQIYTPEVAAGIDPKNEQSVRELETLIKSENWIDLADRLVRELPSEHLHLHLALMINALVRHIRFNGKKWDPAIEKNKEIVAALVTILKHFDTSSLSQIGSLQRALAKIERQHLSVSGWGLLVENPQYGECLQDVMPRLQNAMAGGVAGNRARENTQPAHSNSRYA
jgi:hypothetical protein